MTTKAVSKWHPAKYAKAIAAAIAAGLASLVIALDDNVITTREYLIAAIATLSALGVTYAVPNKR